MITIAIVAVLAAVLFGAGFAAGRSFDHQRFRRRLINFKGLRSRYDDDLLDPPGSPHTIASCHSRRDLVLAGRPADHIRKHPPPAQLKRHRVDNYEDHFIRELRHLGRTRQQAG